jgi:hypothetical protein
MASAVAGSFTNILARVALNDADLSAFETHRSRVESSLHGSFDLSKVVRVGSYARGSAIRFRSDLDLFIVLRRRETEWGDQYVLPSTILNRLREALRGTFPQSSLGRDGQAVVVEFSDNRRIDVVPARFENALDNGWPLYRIPSGADEWIATSPELHNKYIADGDARSGGKLKSVVRLLKYWRQCRNPELPLSAFHLELLLAKEGTCNGGRSLAACVADALILLERRACRALQDPCGVSGYIPAAATESKLERLLAAVGASAASARDALYYEAFGNLRETRRRWSAVFNNYFP